MMNTIIQKKLQVLVMLVIESIFLQLVNGSWRITPTGLLPSHFLVLSDTDKFFISDTESLSLTSSDKTIVDWKIVSLPLCDVNHTQSEVHLLCPTTGKREIKFAIPFVTATCMNCTTVIENAIVKISETPFCYYWTATSFFVRPPPHESTYYLQITLKVIHPHFDDAMAEELMLNHLLYSRQEKLIFKNSFGKSFDDLQISFSPVSHMWDILIPKHQLSHRNYATITSPMMTPLMGCAIAPTIILLNERLESQRGNSDSSFRLIRLISSNNIIGQLKYHVCAPERALLATANGIYYTTNEFESSIKLFISSEITFVYGAVVTHFELTKDVLLIILQGEMFAASVFDKNLRFKRVQVHSGRTDSLLGISLLPLCLVNANVAQQFSWETDYIMTWSSSNLFVHRGFQDDVAKVEGWEKLRFSEEYSGYIIIKVKLENIPKHLWILANHKNSIELLECTFHQLDYLSCSDLTFLSQVRRDFYEWGFLNSAHSSAILWTDTSLIYTYDDGERHGTFSEVTSVKTVVFNLEKTKYLVVTKENVLYYGSGKCTQLMRLRRVDSENSTDLVYKFRYINDDTLRISWDAQSVTQQVYPLYNELYSVLQSSDKESEFCDHAYFITNLYEQGGNVVSFEDKDQEIFVNFSFIYPASSEVFMNIRTFFHDLVVFSNQSTKHETTNIPGRPPMRVHTFEAVLRATCTGRGSQCDKGMAVFEIALSTNYEKTTCLLPISHVLYVNVTCPDGLHVRIRPGYSSSSLQCSMPVNNAVRTVSIGDYKDLVCFYNLTHPYLFYPIVEVYSHDRFLYTVSDDLQLTEIKNKTGIELTNRNFMLKDCHLCEQFHPLTPSSIILQTSRSACPCKLDKYDPNLWTGNLSFLYVELGDDVPDDAAESWKNALMFDVTVLGNSYCDLSRRLLLGLLPKPSVPATQWETQTVGVFIGFTLMLLAISYWKYRTDYHSKRKENSK